jgi:flagellar hook-basal body complex protein FliE
MSIMPIESASDLIPWATTSSPADVTSQLTDVSGTDSSSSLSGLSGTSGVSGTDTSGFGDILSSSVDSLQASQSKAGDLALQAATGDLTDVHDYTIAATEASLQTELATTLRNKGLEAFQEIMRMQI